MKSLSLKEILKLILWNVYINTVYFLTVEHLVGNHTLLITKTGEILRKIFQISNTNLNTNSTKSRVSHFF